MNFTRLLLRLALGRRLPVTTGELRVRGPLAPITIRRDTHGIPHIDAESELDACFGVGFCQGQDRAAQLELLWRIGRGRLAEWVGPAGLAADRMSRRIGFRRAAEKQVPTMADGPRAQFVAFAAGLSVGNTAGLSKKPHEFALLGGEPSAWDAADVLAVLKLQSLALASNWDLELARLRILLADGPEAMRAVDPVASVSRDSKGSEGLGTLLFESRLRELEGDLAGLQRFLPTGGGSNNWIIAGSRTASGKPLVANDPHLEPTTPPPWHFAHARCPEWEVAGACFIGSPGFPIAHNGSAAWGVTAGLSDNADIFIETLGADSRSTKEPDGTFAPCEVFHEVIRVKGEPDETVEALLTPRGPIISPLTADIPLALSLKAVWLQATPVNGFLGTLHTKSFDEFRRCFEHWPLLPLNIVYADANGALGYQLIGEVPRRAGGSGLLPRLADNAAAAWVGMVPFEELPHKTEFPAGYFATANNDPAAGIGDRGSGIGTEKSKDEKISDSVSSPITDSRSPIPVLGVDYCDPYRLRTITDALAAKEGWTVADCLALQRSVRSIPWEEVRDIVLSLTPSDRDAVDALELLREWDGVLDSESPAACVFELFISEMCVRTVRLKAPRSWLSALGEGDGRFAENLFSGRRIGHVVRLIREQPAGWFASWPAEMERVLGDVVRKLRRDVGPGPAYWAWGHLRRLRLGHHLFQDHPWLGPVFNLGPVPCGGDTNTVSQAAVRPAAPTEFTHNMANMRAVFDLNDLSKSQFVLCGGQSGNPWSPYHADQFSLWQAGESIAIPWLQAEVIRATQATMRLLPGG